MNLSAVLGLQLIYSHPQLEPIENSLYNNLLYKGKKWSQCFNILAANISYLQINLF